jgi:hypothetical protein
MSPHRDITRQIVRNHQRPCRCHGCTQSRQRRRNASWMALLVVLMLVGAAIAGSAQIPVPEPIPIQSATVCIYHPESLQTSDPAQRPVIVHARRYGWPSPVPAIEYIRSEWPSGNPDRQAEAISAAIQYSIYLSPGKIADAQRVTLADYLPHLDRSTVPAMSLHQAVREYLWTGNTLHRSNMAYWLRRVVESRSNVDCNPWHPYREIE